MRTDKQKDSIKVAYQLSIIVQLTQSEFLWTKKFKMLSAHIQTYRHICLHTHIIHFLVKTGSPVAL